MRQVTVSRSVALVLGPGDTVALVRRENGTDWTLDTDITFCVVLLQLRKPGGR